MRPRRRKIAFVVVQHLGKAGVEQVLNVLNTVRAARVFNIFIYSCSSEVVLHMFNTSAKVGVEHAVHNTCTTLNRRGWYLYSGVGSTTVYSNTNRK